MSRIFQQLRKPAVATTAAAAAVLAVAFLAYGLSRLHPHGSSTAFHPSPSATKTTSSLPTGGPSSTASPIPSTSPSGSGGSPTATAPPGGSEVIAWIMEYTPGGTGGGGQPTSLFAYDSFWKTDCQRISYEAASLAEPARTLYEGASAACMAAFRGHPERWAQAEADLSQVDPNAPGFQCYDRDAYAMLRSLVEIHRRYPGYRIVRGQPSANRTGCPLITQVVPDNGPVQGGQQVQVLGVNLPSTLIVDFGVTSASPVPSNGTEATVITPASNVPGVEPVYVDGLNFEIGVSYTYVLAPPTASPSGSP